jgi:hypothetical protein
VTTEQQAMVDGILRKSAFPVGSTAQEQRQLLRAALSAQPLPADLTVTAGTLGGVPTAEITIAGIEPRHVILYFHGAAALDRAGRLLSAHLARAEPVAA